MRVSVSDDQCLLLAAHSHSIPPDGTVKAVMITAVQSERSAALATLFTVHVARFAVSVFDPVPLGRATAAATRAARRTKAVSEGMA